MKPFKLIITKINGPLYDAEAFSVTLPGEAGEMTVLAHHEAFITRMKPGTITVTHASGTESYPVDSGIVEIADNVVTILL